MKKIVGFKGDALQVESFEYSSSSGGQTLRVNATIVDSSSEGPSIVAHITALRWSDETVEALKAFLSRLEEDLCSQVGQGSDTYRTSIQQILGERR